MRTVTCFYSVSIVFAATCDQQGTNPDLVECQEWIILAIKYMVVRICVKRFEFRLRMIIFIRPTSLKSIPIALPAVLLLIALVLAYVRESWLKIPRSWGLVIPNLHFSIEF